MRHENLKENSKSEKHAAHVFTEVNASLTLSVSGQTSENSYLFCYMIPDYKFHEINSDV